MVVADVVDLIRSNATGCQRPFDRVEHGRKQGSEDLGHAAGQALEERRFPIGIVIGRRHDQGFDLATVVTVLNHKQTVQQMDQRKLEALVGKDARERVVGRVWRSDQVEAAVEEHLGLGHHALTQSQRAAPNLLEALGWRVGGTCAIEVGEGLHARQGQGGIGRDHGALFASVLNWVRVTQ